LPHALAEADPRPTFRRSFRATGDEMGLLDGARNLIGDVTAAAERMVEEIGSGKLALALAKFYPGGLAAFLDRLPEAVTERLAYDLSVPEARVATALAEFLPAAVAGQSENGQLKPQPNFSTQVA
jgi:hypothetical protein